MSLLKIFLILSLALTIGACKPGSGTGSSSNNQSTDPSNGNDNSDPVVDNPQDDTDNSDPDNNDSPPDDGNDNNDNVDNTPAPIPKVAISSSNLNVSIAENQNLAITLTLEPAAPQALQLGWTLTGGGAGDFTGALSGNLAIAEGDTSVTLNVPVINDSVVELTENYTVTFSGDTDSFSNDLNVAVELTDNDPNTNPNAVNDSGTTLVDQNINFAPAVNDTDSDSHTLTITSFTQGTNGAVTDAGGGTLTYDPNVSFSGTDSFTYTIDDGFGGTDTGTVNVYVINQVTIIDDSDADFVTVGSWVGFADGAARGGASDYNLEGTGTDTATWTFNNLGPGSYKVSSSHAVSASWAQRAPFSVYDGAISGANLLGTAFSYQETAADDLTDTINYENLGWVTITGNQLNVQLTDLSDDAVVADSIRVEYIGTTIDWDSIWSPNVRIIDQAHLGSGWVAPDDAWWGGVNAANFGGSHLLNFENTGNDKFTWEFKNLTPGAYRVSASYYGNHAYSYRAPFKIFDGDVATGTLKGIAHVNQYLAADSFTDGSGQAWEDLGYVQISNTQLTVELNDNADDAVQADAIRIERVGSTIDYDTIFGTNVRIIDQSTIGTNLTTVDGDWGINIHANAYGGATLSNVEGTGNDFFTWHFKDLQPGAYRIQFSVYAIAAFSEYAPYTIYDGDHLTGTVLGVGGMNQTDPPDDFTDGNSFPWENFGYVDITGTQLTVKLSDNGSPDSVSADAVRIERLGDDIDYDSIYGTNIRIIDNSDLGTSKVGNTWYYTTGANAIDDESLYHSAGSGTNKFNWEFENLTPGAYRVMTSYANSAGYEFTGLFSVFDGDTSTGTLQGTANINFGYAADDLTDGNGELWEEIGYVVISGSKLGVQLTDNATQPVIADAIRIERVGASIDWDGLFGTDVKIKQISDFGVVVTDGDATWDDSISANCYNDYQAWVASGDGTTKVTWTFDNLPSGTYRVSANWNPMGGPSTNTPFEVFDNAASEGTTNINQSVAPSLFADNGVNWDDIGSYSITSGILKVEVTNNANGNLAVGSIRIERTGP